MRRSASERPSGLTVESPPGVQRRPLIRVASHASALAFVIVSAGCSGIARMPRPPEHVTPEIIAGRVDANFAQLEDLRSRAKIRLTTPEGIQKVNALIQYRKPDRVKIEVYGFLGIALWQAVTSDERLRAYIPRLNEAIDAPAEARVVAGLTGVDVRLDDVTRVLRGGGLDTTALAHISAFERRGDAYLIVTSETGRVRHFWVDATSLHVRETEGFDERGTRLSRTVLADYTRTADVWLPRAITVERGPGRVELTLKEPQVNRGLTDTDFTLMFPEGTRITHME